MLHLVPILTNHNPSLELALQVDISKSVPGAVVLQNGRPIEFAACLLTRSPHKWTQIEKESFSVHFELERYTNIPILE